MHSVTKVNEKHIDEPQCPTIVAITPRERATKQFIKEAFTGKMKTLIDYSQENQSILNLASYLLNYTIGSYATLYQYVFGIHRFCKWLNKCPDEIIEESTIDSTNINKYINYVENFIGDLRAEGLAPGTINNHVKGIKALFRANRLNLTLPHKLSKRVIYPDRAPTPDELTKVIDLAAIREKVIVSLLALGGFRVGTLVKLEYRHVKKDFEAHRVPVHIHIEAEITKGKYSSYDTFIGIEAANYLRIYLEARRQGSIQKRMPPEKINDNSPLIRDAHKSKVIKSISTGAIHRIINNLYVQAGLIKKGSSKRYELRPHSIRKYFRTQLGSLATFPTDYIDYMMGHKVSTYNDVRMKGIDFLRNLYAQSALSIKPKTKLTKIDQLKTIISAWGLNPSEILSKEALSKPHRTVVDPTQHTIAILNRALKQAIIKELKEDKKSII